MEYPLFHPFYYLKKRRMKKKMSFILFAAIFPLSLVLQLGCKPAQPKKEIGLELYSVRDDMDKDPVATIEAVGKIGYTSVEPANYKNGKFYDMSPEDFISLVKKNGMRVISSHCGKDFSGDDGWEDVMAWWDTCIAAHKILGAEYIIEPGIPDTAYKNLDLLKKYCEYLNAVGEKCKAQGIQLGYHNHKGEFVTTDNIIAYDFMLQNLDPGKVVMQMDLGWITEAGYNPIDYFHKYPGRFPLWHVKDEKDLGASGKMDFKAIFENAALAGLKYIVVEQEASDTTILEGVKRSYEFLNAADYVK
jgi:sugar phosphate isomerase/epimerase